MKTWFLILLHWIRILEDLQSFQKLIGLALSHAKMILHHGTGVVLSQGRQVQPQGLLLERKELTAAESPIFMTENLIAS